MAVARRVLVQIVLVILLCRIEILQRPLLDRQRCIEKLLLLGEDFVDDAAVGLVSVPDSGAVTGAAVLALAVEAGGIDSLEIKLQKESEGDAEGIVFNTDSLRKTSGIGIDLFIGRILRVAVGVTSLETTPRICLR